MNEYFHILLKPDVFYRDILKNVLDMLSEYEVKIYAADIIRPNRILLKIMYDNDFKWEYDYYFHNMRLFELGPSLSLICKNDGENSYKSIKGSSLPIHSYANSIRDYFKVKDRCLNLIHIADTNEQSHQELSLIYYMNQSNNQLLASLLPDQILEIVHSILIPNNTYSYHTVAEKLTAKINHRIRSILYLQGIINTIDLAIDTSIFNEYIPSSFKRLSSMQISLESVIKNEYPDKKIRFLDYLFVLCEREMIYISDMEKYIIYGQGYYSSINLLN